MSITLADIAEKAGVSVAAVSKALSDQSDIAPATRRRIKQLAGEMGYVMNVAARTLTMKKTMAIGVVLPLAHIPAVTDRLRGIQAEAMERRYLTSVAFHNGGIDEERKQIEMLYGRVDGFVITPANQSLELAKLLKRLDLPVVCMSEPLVKMETDFSGDDDEEGGRLAAAHLLERGRERIAYLGYAEGTPSDQAILKGMREVFAGKGLSLDKSWIRWGNASQAETRANMDALLAMTPRPDAIMAFSDVTALWVLEHLERRKVAVPGEVAVAGYDDTIFAELGRMPLTSVAQPNFEIGRQAARLLLERLEDESGAAAAPCRRVVFKPRLAVRMSSG
ncbi:MAG: LacI family DNA-binding transcriptional regulator [Verrucomicrobiae bacterium]|nr:LacI family DNA-binding transcriptional regulator [Verrucomicrobiae bacterium]